MENKTRQRRREKKANSELPHRVGWLYVRGVKKVKKEKLTTISSCGRVRLGERESAKKRFFAMLCFANVYLYVLQCCDDSICCKAAA